MMRSPDEARSRWRVTIEQCESLKNLQRAVRYNGDESPALKGCRSLCWKVFLLFNDVSEISWSHTLEETRSSYEETSNHFLKFIKHPEALATLNVDPLADDPESPWNSLRQDETLRAEVAQDVRRLPDEPFYHQPHIQTMIIDILFVYCKLNPSAGGYRQGMHELLAPILCVVEADAVDRSAGETCADDDVLMMGVLDGAFVEHDAFALFSKVMDRAGPFYEVDGGGAQGGTVRDGGSSEIVEKSKFIHEVCLMKVDPELAMHLKSIEILPQIFLIRWIRLLFGREFPFDQVLVLWDTLFAVDPKLDLIDLICVAMLIRIRWDLLEADYSVCLQLLLKYPTPAAPHGPHTFVDDAVYLKDHLNPSGATSLVMKYTGRMPTPVPVSARPTTPNFQGLGSFRSRNLGGGRSPLPSPSRFIQQQGGVEALFQNATKGVLERGEKLGINQAVRDAMGEIRRNMQNLQDARQSPKRNAPSARIGGDGAAAAMERRNRQLARMLDETIDSLRSVVESGFDEKAKSLELVELAAAKVQFVKIYLEDSSIEVPELIEKPKEGKEDVKMHVAETPAAQTPATSKAPLVEPDPMPPISTLSLAEQPKLAVKPKSAVDAPKLVPASVATNSFGPPNSDAMETDAPPSSTPAQPPTSPTITSATAPTASATTLRSASEPTKDRPQAPIPTRSTLAQSSFAWMLESDATGAAAQPPSLPPSKQPPNHRKRPSGNASRERNAFLFGEVISDADDQSGAVTSEEIFGLQPIRSRKAKTPL